VRAAILHNPAVRALYRRLKAKGRRGDVAIGHCMRKLLHLVFAVWKTNRPFDKNHYPWEDPTEVQPVIPTSADASPSAARAADKKAAGHKRDLPAKKVVTAATPTVGAVRPSVKASAQVSPQARPQVDYAFLRQHIMIEQVLAHLGHLSRLRGRGQQRRGP